MENKYQIEKFCNKQDYLIFIDNMINELSKKGEFNIFAHMISSSNDEIFNSMYKTSDEKINEKVQGILMNKLKISDYSTINGTMTFLGCSNNISAQDLLNYEYYKNMENKTTCIIAIPKFILVNGEKFEYSSFNGVSIRQSPKELLEEYASQYLTPDGHHTKCCLFDSIKGYNDLPPEYLLGIQRIVESRSKYSFLNPHTHLIEEPADLITEHNKAIENKILENFNKYQTCDLAKVIVNSYKDDQSWYDYLVDFEI